MSRVSAIDLAARVVDEGSFLRWDSEPRAPLGLDGDPDPAYLEQLSAARAKTGLDESVMTGEALLGGRRIAIVMCDFAFLAGSIGVAAAERLVQTIERATAEQLPLFAVPTSGGTRMQEGTVAFLQMVKIAAAVAAHKAAGLPDIVYLRHPTTGGVFASWGSLGHVTAAEPGALVGFLGPRVYESLYGEPFPADVQTAENLARHGLVDAVVDPEELRGIAINVLTVLCARRDPAPPIPELVEELVAEPETWDAITRSRRPDRPGVRALLRGAANTVTPLQGTGQGEHDPGLLLALARFGRSPCVILAQDRRYVDRPMGRQVCARPAAACAWPRSLACRW
jgi:acetyl-CoA carboxylase carboxyl transferase beta subunit